MGECVGLLGLDADDACVRPETVANNATGRRTASTADRHKHEIDTLENIEDFSPVSADAGDEQWLVGVVNVAPPIAACDVLDPFARLVEVAPVLDKLGSKRAESGILVGIVPHRDDDATADSVKLTGERQ